MKWFAKIKSSIKNLDKVLFACTSILTIMSLLTIWFARENFGMTKFITQLGTSIAGIVIMLILVNFDYRNFVDKYFYIIIIVSALFLAITLFFGITGINNDSANKSWLTIIKIGSKSISIQPSEFVKIAFIMTFAKHLSDSKDSINKIKTLVPLVIHAGIIVGLIVLSGDIGVALVYIGIVLIMFFSAGLSINWFLILFGIILIAFPFLWPFLKEYQQERILVGFNPDLDPTGKGFQPILSRNAIISGGLFGRGFHEGGFYEDLPASHTDFIFSTYCEFFGFVGAILLLLTMTVLVLRIIVIAKKCRNLCGSLVCLGIAGMFIIQIVENIGMCLAVLPVIGITLPFMSCGGSSMFALYVAMGLVHSIESYQKRYALEGQEL